MPRRAHRPAGWSSPLTWAQRRHAARPGGQSGTVTRGLNSTQCLLAQGYLAPAAGALVDSAVDTTLAWDTSCFQTSTGTLDVYLYALNSSSQLLPIHGWRSVPASKGSTRVKLAPHWWIADAHTSQNQSLYINIVPSGNQPWDTSNPTGPSWTAMYTAPAKGHNPPKDALADPSASDQVVSVFYASGGLTGAGKTAAIVCPIIVVLVLLALLIRKLHINRNNKTADFAEKVDKRMGHISIDWAAGGDGRSGPVPGSRPASYYQSTHPHADGRLFGGHAPPAPAQGAFFEGGAHNMAGFGAGPGAGWGPDGSKPGSNLTMGDGPGAVHKSMYDPFAPSPLGQAQRSAAPASDPQSSWYPIGPPGYLQSNETEPDDLDDLGAMSNEEKMGARPLSVNALDLVIPGGKLPGSSPAAAGTAALHDTAITPSEEANPFELPAALAAGPAPGPGSFNADGRFAGHTLLPLAKQDGAMLSTGPIGHAHTVSDEQRYGLQPAYGGAAPTAAQPFVPGALGASASGARPAPAAAHADTMADDPWSVDLDGHAAVPVHVPRASESWTHAEYAQAPALPAHGYAGRAVAAPDPVPEFAAYQAATAAGLAESGATVPAYPGAAAAGGHGRSTSVSHQTPSRNQGVRHVRQASSVVPRTLIGAAAAPHPHAASGDHVVDTSLASNEAQVVDFTDPRVAAAPPSTNR